MATNLVLRRGILLGVPLATAVLMFFHPAPYDDVAGELVPIAGWWIAIHTVQFVLFALAGASVWLLVEGLGGVEATIARVGAIVFAIFYDLGDAVAGIGTGILAGAAAEASAGERAGLLAGIEALFAHPVTSLAFVVGILGWVVALLAAAGTLWKAGAPRVPVVLLVLPALFISFDHAFPFGSLTFGTLFLFALWIELSPWNREERLAAGSTGAVGSP